MDDTSNYGRLPDRSHSPKGYPAGQSGPHIVNWGNNYLAVNINDLNLPQVKVKCVLKTTDCVLPLPVKSFYGTKHHCAPMIFFQRFTPPKFIIQGQVTWPQREWRCRLWLSSRLVWLKANSPGNKRNPSDKSTVHGKPSWLSAFST